MVSAKTIELPCGSLSEVESMTVVADGGVDDNRTLRMCFDVYNPADKNDYKMELVFSHVYEYRWIEFEFPQEFPGDDYYEYHLTEIENSPYLELPARKEYYSSVRWESIWGKDSPERPRHFGILINQHGTYVIIAASFEAHVLDVKPRENRS